MKRPLAFLLLIAVMAIGLCTAAAEEEENYPYSPPVIHLGTTAPVATTTTTSEVHTQETTTTGNVNPWYILLFVGVILCAMAIGFGLCHGCATNSDLQKARHDMRRYLAQQMSSTN